MGLGMEVNSARWAWRVASTDVRMRFSPMRTMSALVFLLRGGWSVLGRV